MYYKFKNYESLQLLLYESSYRISSNMNATQLFLIISHCILFFIIPFLYRQFSFDIDKTFAW